MRLAQPAVHLQRSYLAAMGEFLSAGEERYAEPPSWPAEGEFPGVDFTLESLRDARVFAEYVRFLHDQQREEAPRPRAYVAYTELWMVHQDEFVGRISLRHDLNELLFTWGGHIGYSVRPSARRQGFATAALAQMLDVCRGKEIDPVLVTCDEDNVASRRVIEGAGGVYEDSREGKRRYWISLDG